MSNELTPADFYIADDDLDRVIGYLSGLGSVPMQSDASNVNNAWYLYLRTCLRMVKGNNVHLLSASEIQLLFAITFKTIDWHLKQPKG